MYDDAKLHEDEATKLPNAIFVIILFSRAINAIRHGPVRLLPPPPPKLCK